MKDTLESKFAEIDQDETLSLEQKQAAKSDLNTAEANAFAKEAKAEQEKADAKRKEQSAEPVRTETPRPAQKAVR